MLTTRWTTLGPPTGPTVAFLRGVGQVRITQDDVDRYGESYLEDDPELLLERVMDDPEARYRISGPVPKPADSRPKRVAADTRPQRSRSRGWLARLFGG